MCNAWCYDFVRATLADRPAAARVLEAADLGPWAAALAALTAYNVHTGGEA